MLLPARGFLINRRFSWTFAILSSRIHVLTNFWLPGEPIKAPPAEKEALTEYEQLVNSFYENLKAKRKSTKLMQEQNRRRNVKKVLKKFPGWDELTVSNLHNLFLLFDENKNAMLNVEDL